MAGVTGSQRRSAPEPSRGPLESYFLQQVRGGWHSLTSNTRTSVTKTPACLVRIVSSSLILLQPPMTEPGCARTGSVVQTSYPLAERTDEAIERHWREMVEHRAPLQTTQSDGMCFLGRQKPMMDNRGHADWRTAPVKRTVQLVILFLLFALYGLAWADYFNGHDLVKHMNSADRHDVAMFRGYIAGVQDVYNGEVFASPVTSD